MSGTMNGAESRELRRKLLAMRQPIEVGEAFGRLVAVRKSERVGYWLFQCACGGTKEVRVDMARGGHTKSCGCIRKEKSENAKRPKKPKNRFAVSMRDYKKSGVVLGGLRLGRNSAPVPTHEERIRGLVLRLEKLKVGIDDIARIVGIDVDAVMKFQCAGVSAAETLPGIENTAQAEIRDPTRDAGQSAA